MSESNSFQTFRLANRTVPALRYATNDDRWPNRFDSDPVPIVVVFLLEKQEKPLVSRGVILGGFYHVIPLRRLFSGLIQQNRSTRMKRNLTQKKKRGSN